MAAVTKLAPGLTVILPPGTDAQQLLPFVDALRQELAGVVDELEILVLDVSGDEALAAACQPLHVNCIGSPGNTLGDALRTAFGAAHQDLVATMDGDGSHDPACLRWMLAAVGEADVVIGSRYVPRGGQETSGFRDLASRLLNAWIGWVCALPSRDLTGKFRLYRRAVLAEVELESPGPEIQSELIVRAFGHGFRVREVPVWYRPQSPRRGPVAAMRYAWAFVRSTLRLRRYRNSIDFCDYDERAYRSRIPFQRLWQRTRYARMMRLLQPTGAALDVGCGCGRLILAWPRTVGLDANPKVLRYLAQEGRTVVQGSAEALPFAAATFDTVFCCEVVEHLPQDSPVFAEVARVLRPGGRLLVTTPDYGGWAWPILEWLYKLLLPHAYGHTHISRYDRPHLLELLTRQGLTLVAEDRMFGAILLMVVTKPGAAPGGSVTGIAKAP